jgi:hypothetical protein
LLLKTPVTIVEGPRGQRGMGGRGGCMWAVNRLVRFCAGSVFARSLPTLLPSNGPLFLFLRRR